jgi:hypothetical protein
MMTNEEVVGMNFDERGSIYWFMFSGTQLWLSFILADQMTTAIETLFGASAAALFLIGIVAFRKEQRELLLNPIKPRKEVHEDQINGQKSKFKLILNMWMTVMVIGYFMFNH